MRLLFTAPPGYGHLFPMIPLAQAALAAGHDALIGTSGPTVSGAVNAGLAAIDVAPDEQVATPYAALGSAIMDERMSHGDLVQAVFGKFGEISELMLDGIFRAAKEWRADAVVYPPAFPAGLVAARAAGIPAVLHGIGFRRPTLLPALENVKDAGAMLGADESAEQPDVEINVSPDSIEPDPVPGTLPMRYGSYNGGAQLPWWSLTKGTRPRVAVTLGSMSSTLREGELLSRVVEGTADLGLELVITSASLDLPALADPLPEHVRLVSWLPLNVLLTTCSAVIHHGGAGSTFAALRAGTPQVIIPHGGDRQENADAVQKRGCGGELPLSAAPPGEIGHRLRAVLGEPEYQVAARDVAAEMQAMPSPQTAVSDLAARLVS